MPCGSSAETASSAEPSARPVDYCYNYKPQGGALIKKGIPYWQHGCDRIQAKNGQGKCLKSPVLSYVALDKFLFAIANPDVGCDFDWLALHFV